MNIGFVIYGDLDTVSGGNIYDSEVIRMLQKSGHSVTLLTLERRTYYRNIFHNFTGTFLDRIKQHNLDLLLEDELVHPSLFYLNHWIRSRFSIPIIAIVHNLTRFSSERPVFQFFSRKVEKWYIDSLYGFIAVSKKTQHQVNQISKQQMTSTVAYPAGDRFRQSITEEEIEQRSKSSGPLRILFLGNITPNKQLDILISAMKLSQERNYSVHVIGNTSSSTRYESQCRRLIRTNNLQDSVAFLGPITDLDKLAEELSNAHVLVLPSKSEGFPLVLVEAAGFGIPAIITTESAAGEFVQHTVNGFLVKPYDVDAIAEYLHLLHTDRDYLTKVSIAALMRYRTHPTWSETGQQIEQFLKQFSREDRHDF